MAETTGKKKKFNKKLALGTDFDYREFIDAMPEEIRGELEGAVTQLLRYVHQKEVTEEILAAVASQEDVGTAIAQISLQSMDAIDPEHALNDATKAVAGYFLVKEIIGVIHAAGVARLGKDDVAVIYKNAVQNYLYQTVASQPDQGGKEREAMRIQQEIEPLLRAQQQQNAGDTSQGDAPAAPTRGGLSQ